jgi:hypothetical protein
LEKEKSALFELTAQPAAVGGRRQEFEKLTQALPAKILDSLSPEAVHSLVANDHFMQ